MPVCRYMTTNMCLASGMVARDQFGRAKLLARILIADQRCNGYRDRWEKLTRGRSHMSLIIFGIFFLLGVALGGLGTLDAPPVAQGRPV
jgi:hypothetical protein